MNFNIDIANHISYKKIKQSTNYLPQKPISKSMSISQLKSTIHPFSQLKSSTAKMVTRSTNTFLGCLQKIWFFRARQIQQNWLTSWMIRFLGPQHWKESTCALLLLPLMRARQNLSATLLTTLMDAWIWRIWQSSWR